MFFWYLKPRLLNRVPSSFISGTHPSIAQMIDLTARFLYLTRPRGKALPKSRQTELNILSRLLRYASVWVWGHGRFTNFKCQLVSCILNDWILGGIIKAEAWVLRRMVSIFSMVARRPHTPRERGIQQLFEAIGISPTGGSSSTLEGALQPNGFFSSLNDYM